ncbi:ParA family protein [Leptolyngbyaceae cyanobacterium UHCC 1019]
MIIVVLSFKGGVSKTITAIHVAESLSKRRGRKVVLGDGDAIRTALNWYKRGVAAGHAVGFTVFDGDEQPPDGFTDLVIDTPGNPDEAELSQLANAADFLIIPTSCSPAAIEATIQTLTQFDELPRDHYRVLLSLVPPRPSRRGERVQQALNDADIPTFTQTIQRRDCYLDAELAGCTVSMLPGKAAMGAAREWKAVGDDLWKLTKLFRQP